MNIIYYIYNLIMHINSMNINHTHTHTHMLIIYMVKFLPSMHEYLSQNPMQTLIAVLCVCNPSCTGSVKTSGSLELTGQSN